jgi:hypothetical protein
MSDNKSKNSLKGSRENLSIAPLNKVFLAAFVIATALRCIQMAKFIDPQTGFLTGGSALNIILYVVLAAAIAVFCAVSFLSADCKNAEIGGLSDSKTATSARLMAIGFVVDCISSFIAGVYNFGSSATGYTDVMKSGTLPMMLQSFFALFSAVYFFILASDFSKGTEKVYKRKILATAPVFWAGARLIYRFLRQISFIEVSDLFLELIMIAFMVMFFMALAQVASGVYKDTVKWRLAGFGLSAGVIAAVLSASRLIMSLVSVIGAADYTVSGHSFTFADLLFALFAVSLAVKIKEDAKRPAVSAVYEDKAE